MLKKAVKQMEKKHFLNSRLSWQRWLVNQGYQISCCI